MSEDDEKKLIKRGESQLTTKTEHTIQLGAKKEIDLSYLTKEQIGELKYQHTKGLIDVDIKAAELGVDTQALRSLLQSMGDETKNIADSGGSVTISTASESSIGKTEIMMGTSDMAKKGKLSKSVTGEKDYKLIYTAIAAFVLIVLAYFIFRLKWPNTQ